MEVTVIIEKDGSTTIDVEGAGGRSCEAVTEAITRALGGEVNSVRHKDEYFAVTEGEGVDTHG